MNIDNVYKIIKIIVFILIFFISAIFSHFFLSQFVTPDGLVNTMRYFYSAIFQGFSALLALGSMYYLFFKQQYNSELKDLLFEISTCINFNKKRIDVHKSEILSKAKQKLENVNEESNKLLKYYLDKFENLNKRLIKIEALVKSIVNYSVFILIFSVILLLNVGINKIYAVVGYYTGIIIVLIAANIFLKTSEIIMITIGRRKTDLEIINYE